jgi:hypothetical protein
MMVLSRSAIERLSFTFTQAFDAKAAAEGIKYQPGWILATTATVKVFIDIFIGIWAFILGYIWTNHIEKGPDKARPSEIWERFPKYILASSWCSRTRSGSRSAPRPISPRHCRRLPGRRTCSGSSASF